MRWVLILVSTASAAMANAQQSYLIDWDVVGEESLDHLVELIQINSTNPPGNETDVTDYLSVVLAASAAGFILWNWSPASLFMGDAGSGFIGFALGLLALESLVTQRMSVWSWVLLLGVFIADTAVTLLVRIIRGERWYEGHSQHAYQILSRRLNSHPRVVGGGILIHICWLLPLAWVAGILPHYGVLFATIGLAPLLLGCYRLGAGRADAGEAPIQLN